jgi:hypothetical protein
MPRTYERLFFYRAGELVNNLFCTHSLLLFFKAYDLSLMLGSKNSEKYTLYSMITGTVELVTHRIGPHITIPMLGYSTSHQLWFKPLFASSMRGEVP